MLSQGYRVMVAAMTRAGDTERQKMESERAEAAA